MTPDIAHALLHGFLLAHHAPDQVIAAHQILRPAPAPHFNVSDLLQGFQASGINVADFGLDKIANSGLGQTAQSVVTSVVDELGSLFGGAKKAT